LRNKFDLNIFLVLNHFSFYKKLQYQVCLTIFLTNLAQTT